jgi:MYXO-CTERM domain-containing protein
VTEGCGCRLAGDGSNRSAALVALALAAFAFRRRRLRAPLRPVGRVPIDRRNRRFDDGDDGCGKALRGAREEGQAR